MRRSILASALGISLTACIVEAPLPPGAAPAQGGSAAPRAPSALVPPLEVKSGANFGDAIELTSLMLAPGRGVIGETVRAIASFKVLKKLDVDYSIFVHVEDVDGRVDRINADHPPVRGSLPTSRWEVGQLVRDEFEIPIPPSMAVRGLNIVMGFWDPKTDQRLPLKNPDKVRNDSRDRVFVATLPVVPAQ